MARVEFKSKAEKILDMDGSISFLRIKVPALNQSHCDMDAFRKHPKFGPYANSDLFPAMLRRAAEKKGISRYIRLDKIPDGVRIDCSNFLVKVSFEI